MCGCPATKRIGPIIHHRGNLLKHTGCVDPGIVHRQVIPQRGEFTDQLLESIGTLGTHQIDLFWKLV